MDYRKEAHRLIELGISVLPLRVESKRPSILWKEFQDRLMTSKEVEKYFKDTNGIAGIAGPISRLFVLDFDLDKQLDNQDYWSEFITQVPEELKNKLLINRTLKGGYHIWMRTDYKAPSRKITRRFLTITELMDRYEESIRTGADAYQASQSLLNKPLECVVESRGTGAYAVLLHPSYSRISGDTFQEVSVEEVTFLVNLCYSLDCEFTPLKRISGETADNYAVIRQYNEDTNAWDVMNLLQETGVYTFASEDHNGNIKMKRAGSSNPYSARIFLNSGFFSTFSTDTLFQSEKSNYSPFEVYCACNNFTEQEAVNTLLNG